MALVVFLFILIPLILLLCFTKYFYHCRLIVKYLKPYVDAFQAPFKDSCRYYPGVELLLHCTSFIARGSTNYGYKVHAIVNLNCVLLLIYLSSFRPFKSVSNTILYTSFVLNIQCIVILVMFVDGNTDVPLYVILLPILISAAFAKFIGIILYCLYINYLYKIEFLQHLIMKVNKITYKFKMRNTVKHDSTLFANCNYQQFQEELLDLDPMH